MSLIHEIANAVRTRRREIGLSQAALASCSRSFSIAKHPTKTSGRT